MKKYFLLLISAMMMGTSVYALERIPLTVSYDDTMPLGHGYAKSPMRPPLVYIEDHTLTFSADHPDYLLIIKMVLKVKFLQCRQHILWRLVTLCQIRPRRIISQFMTFVTAI